MVLNDKEIRGGLVNALLSRNKKPERIIHELPINNGNAIADVVAVYKNLHCYEIKGDGDKIERLKVQSVFYNQTFPKITLVTTNKHLQRALMGTPPFWGVMVAYHCEKQNEIKIKHIRKASNNPFVIKLSALQTLWKGEMVLLMKEFDLHLKSSELNRDNLSREISLNINKKDLNEKISNLLKNRKSTFIKHIDQV